MVGRSLAPVDLDDRGRPYETAAGHLQLCRGAVSRPIYAVGQRLDLGLELRNEVGSFHRP
jgi:hypothetical protein